MTAYNSFSDSDLFAFLKEGEHTAFEELYNRYKHPLYLHAYRMLQDGEEAKDLVQELFSSIWAKRQSLANPTAVNAYLYGCLRNRILNVIAHQKVRGNYISSLNSYLEATSSAPDEKIIATDLIKLVENEVALLPPKMREVFEMSRKQHLSHKQIAEHLNISDKTVKKQVNNAIKILRLKINVNFLFGLFF